MDFSRAIKEVPQLARGQVWCLECGATKKISAATGLTMGWPRCCGYTMTIDSPDERAARQSR